MGFNKIRTLTLFTKVTASISPTQPSLPEPFCDERPGLEDDMPVGAILPDVTPSFVLR